MRQRYYHRVCWRWTAASWVVRGYCRGYSGACVASCVCSSVQRVNWKESPLHCSSQRLATEGGSGLFCSQTGGAMGSSQQVVGELMKGEHMQSAAGNLRGWHITSNSWWLVLLLPLRGNKRNLHSLKRTVYMRMLLATDGQSLRRQRGKTQ